VLIPTAPPSRPAPEAEARKARRARPSVPTLAAVLLLTACAFAFAKIAGEVGRGKGAGETRTFDQAVLRALRNPADLADPVGPAWLEEVGRDMTALGGIGVLTLVTVASIGFLLVQRRRRLALLLAAAIGGGQALSLTLKHHFDRPRPALVPHLSWTATSSFPSGHALTATVTYLTLALLLARTESTWRAKVYLVTVAALLSMLVGVSRVYMGVHWPTDVIAGWAAGTMWAILAWLVVRRVDAEQLAHRIQRSG
jgi:undecaprenyl-diphosphatase